MAEDEKGGIRQVADDAGLNAEGRRALGREVEIESKRYNAAGGPSTATARPAFGPTTTPTSEVPEGKLNEEAESAQPEVSELVGLECWHAALPNREFLQLEIGGVVPIEGSPRSGTMGTHGVIVEAEWELRAADGAVLVRGDDDGARIDELLSHVRGEIVSVDVAPVDLTLELVFANGLCLIGHPVKTAVGEPLWEIFLSGNRMITAREGALSRGWSDGRKQV